MGFLRRNIIRILFLLWILPALNFADTLRFSGINGLPAYQQRASQDPNLTPILNRWKDAVSFYLGRGIHRFPTGLVADLGGAGVVVDFSKTQSQIDAEAAAATSTPPTPATSQPSNPPSASSTGTSPVTSGTGTDGSDSNSGNNGNNNPSNSGTSGGSGNSGNTGSGSSGGTGGNSGGTQVVNTADLGPPKTSFSIARLFGNLIRGLGGYSSNRLGTSPRSGGINRTGSRPPLPNPPNPSGGGTGSGTGGDGSGTDGGDGNGTDGSDGNGTDGGDGNGTDGGDGNGTDGGGEGFDNLGLAIEGIFFREYGNSLSQVNETQQIGTDISEADFLTANQSANPTLAALYEAMKTNSDFQTMANQLLALDPEQDPPRIILGDDNQVDNGQGIHPFYISDPVNELVLGNLGVGDDLEEALGTALHELSHSQQRISFSVSDQKYGPDDSHFSTEVLTEKAAALEGWAEFWEAYYAPEIWGKLEFGLAHCGFRVEDSDSTEQNPKYNGKSVDALECDDYIPFQDLPKEDYFKAEGWFASLLLEIALRIDGSFDLILQAYQATNTEDQTSSDIIGALAALMNDEQKGALTVILDVLTAFQFSTTELRNMTGVSQDALLEYTTVRGLIQDKAELTLDDNNFPVRYNGFHALDTVAGNDVLPRIDTRANTRMTNLGLQPKAATPLDGQFTRAPEDEEDNFFSSQEEEFQELEKDWDQPESHGEIIRNY